MDRKSEILIVDDDTEYLKSLANVLKRDFSVIAASSSEEAKKTLSVRINLVLLDIRLDENDPNNKEGIEILKFIKKEMPDLPVVMMTAYGDVDIAVESMKIGASDFIPKKEISEDIRRFKKVIQNLLETSELKRKLSETKEDYRRVEPWKFVGDNPKILEIKEMIDVIADNGEATVLIQGETGTGKESVARAIHSRGIRKDGPFMPVFMSALSKSVLESELFGHEKGAFTDAYEQRIGYIEKADGGILLLDEIGELDQDIQVKLNRFLDNKTFNRVGRPDLIEVDVQVIATTNRNLEEAIQKGEFRKDLYYRLKTFQIFLPPLSERKDDIPKIAYHFLKFLRAQGKTTIQRISEPATELLKQHSWPGNVRELKSCMEVAITYADNKGHSEIMPNDLPYEVQSSFHNDAEEWTVNLSEKRVDVAKELARVELAYIEKALKVVGGKKTEAWELLNYNDRFAMRRRIEIITDKYPHLLSEFPYIKEKYD